MKNKSTKIYLTLILLILLFFLQQLLTAFYNKFNEENKIVKLINEKNTILVIYNPYSIGKNDYILKAYESVLTEEGIDYLLLSSELFIKKYSFLKKDNIKGIIFPDTINQYLPYDIIFIIKDYLKNSGNIFLVYDVGIKNLKGKYLKESIFSNILGINYITYEQKKENSFIIDQIKILNPDFIYFPLSKLDKNYNIISKYKYKDAFYYLSNIEIKNNNFMNYKIIAKSYNYEIPFILIKKYNKGNIYYVNTPLGYLKAYSDDLILRSNLRAFLKRICNTIYISKLPRNIPSLVLNYHLDANSDWKSIEYMIKNNLLDKEIKGSFHITAGDFRDKEGDKLGFDALNKGKKYVEILKEYGEIGSHGGWAHNYFSYHIIYNPNDPNLYKFIKEYIQKNNEALEKIVGYKIVEYSAPNGAHPQPLNTKILEELNMICYYYTGDMGSCPNLTFYNGQKVSDKILAFPVFPYRNLVSLGEMKRNNIPNQEVKNFLKYIIDYIILSENIILYYTHPYDIFYYPNEYKFFIRYLKQKIKENKIQALTMKEYTEFFFRFIKTKYEYNIDNNKIYFEIYNPYSLKDISIIIPKNYANNIFIKLNEKYLTKKNIKLNQKDSYYELIFNAPVNYANLVLKLK